MRVRTRIGLTAMSLSLWVALPVGAQSPRAPSGPPPPASAPHTGTLVLPGPVRVFIDCGGYRDCDSAYFRTEITYVDHVRDREVADVHVLITGQPTGSGGTEATLAFFGRGPFAGVDDTLTYASPPNAASDTVRANLVSRLTLGLTRYVGHSPAGTDLQVSMPKTAQQRSATPVRDPWNYWVMRISLNGNLGGESSSNRSSFSGNVSANRTTDAWKIALASFASYRESSYDFGDETRFTSVSRGSSVSALVVKSLGEHWSIGGRTSARSSTYTNKKRELHLAPAIEYDVFPYNESTRRQLTAEYAVGITSVAYRETTLYDKDAEVLPVHSLGVGISARQPWGQVSTSVEASQYLSKLDKHRIESWGNVNLKIGKGLSLNVGGGASWIADQINLPKGSATRDEVLVRQRQLATSYDYSVFFGVSYTFGSIFNNIVNPRFRSGGGGGAIFN